MQTAASPNFLDEAIPPHRQPPGGVRRRLRRTFRAVAITLIVGFLVLSWTTRSSDPNPYVALRDSATVRTLRSLITNPTQALAGAGDDRINVLLIGMGGVGHEGPLLADTILIASVERDGSHPVLISVPRDLLLPLPDGTFEKANAVHAYAEDRDRRGAEALRDALHVALGIDVPHFIRVDFRGFVGLVDELGGVDVDVLHTLDDPSYPIAGNEDAPWEERYEHLVIPAGLQHLDGALALKYVRSRSARGSEGSDFARGRRQQQLLRAVRAAAQDDSILARARTVKALLNTWKYHLATNLDPPELVRMAELLDAIPLETITQIVFTDDPASGELLASRWNGAYVLRPRGGSYDILRETVAHALDASAPAPATRLRVVILNGTSVAGLALETAKLLDERQFAIVHIGNAPRLTIDETIIYYRNESDDALRATAIAELVKQFHAVTSPTFPLLDALSIDSDILIVLGGTSVRAANGPEGTPAS
ncbi:MAG: LCP family protein [bacterium]|nr:LCP family protein [bacterium]